MVMKIIRHSRKMFVYSLSLLLCPQQISCMQASTAPAAHTDQKSISQLTTMLAEHNNVDQLIDTMQKALGAIDDQDGTSHHNFTLTVPARGNKLATPRSYTQDELAKFLCAMQDQRQIYDDAFWFNWGKYWQKNYNKQLIRNNFVPVTMAAYAKRCKDFNPETSLINNLPKSAQALNSLNIITNLQAGFASIDPQKKCLSMKVSDILNKLSTMHDFFDNPPCCWYSSAQDAEKLNYNVFLRSHTIPFVYFIEKQKDLKALALPKQMPASGQPQSASIRKKPSVLIIEGAEVHTLSAKPQAPPAYAEPSHQLGQKADPFIPGSAGEHDEHQQTN